MAACHITIANSRHRTCSAYEWSEIETNVQQDNAFWKGIKNVLKNGLNNAVNIYLIRVLMARDMQFTGNVDSERGNPPPHFRRHVNAIK